MADPQHWDEEIARIAKVAPDVFRRLPDAAIGVAVDDANKRDYFSPRLQRLMTEQRWSGTIRIVPMNGEPPVFLRARPDGD